MADASVVVAALVDATVTGRWARDVLADQGVAAPALLPYEVASTLRRLSRLGVISLDTAALAHADLGALPIELFPYAPGAGRVWELRNNLTPYDASYVALAESLGAEVATLDRRLTRAPGARCSFRTP